MKPINVKERLPLRKELPVLIWMESCKIWISCGAPIDVNFVQWWMPMPPPPEYLIRELNL